VLCSEACRPASAGQRFICNAAPKRPGHLHHRPARPWRDESTRIGLRTLILTLLGVLTIAALLRRFGTPRPASERCRARPSRPLATAGCFYPICASARRWATICPSAHRVSHVRPSPPTSRRASAGPPLPIR